MLNKKAVYSITLVLLISVLTSSLSLVTAEQSLTSLTANPQAFNPTTTSTNLQFTLTDTTNKPANIKLYNPSNTLTRTIDCGSLSSGTYTYPWNGKDQSNQYVSDGSYKAELNVETDQWNTKFTPLNELQQSWVIKNAAFSGPKGLASDSAGNIYVCDDSNRISKYNANGICILSWGSKGTGDGQFNLPVCLAVDSDGSVYVSDNLNHRIQKFSSQGTFLSKWGSYGTGNGNFNNPRAIGVDNAKNIYVSDSSGRVQKFDSNSNWLASFTGISSYATALTVDASGNIYVADPNYSVIRKISPSGTQLTSWASSWPVGIDIGTDGNVYVMEYNVRQVVKYNNQGIRQSGWGSAGTSNGQFYDPTSLTIDSYGYVYTSDMTPKNVQKFSSSGTFQAKWISTGPAAVEVGPNGYLYVVDKFNNQIQRFTSEGSFVDAWGSKGTGNSQFDSPSGITIDSNGNVYVADTKNNRIQKFTSTGTYIKQWSVSTPYGLAVDSSNNVYAATYTSMSINKYSSEGTPLRSNSFSDPYLPIDIAVDSTDNLYVAIHGSNYIYHYIFVYNQAGSQIRSFGGGGEYAWQYPGTFKSISSIAIDKNDYVYVADDQVMRVTKFFSNGTYFTLFGASKYNGGQLNSPMGLCADNSGNVYIADQENKNIFKYQPANVNAQTYSYKLKWGSYGTSNGQFQTPYGITYNNDGYIYVLDKSAYTVQKFSQNGVFQLKWGSYGSNPEQFRSPGGIASDSAGNIYVLDHSNYASTYSVKVFSPTGAYIKSLTQTITRTDLYAEDLTIDNANNVYAFFRPQSDTYGYYTIQKLSSDGTLIYEKTGYSSSNELLYSPKGIAVDSTGNLYVVDYYGIKKFDSNGNLLTKWGEYGLSIGQFQEGQRIEIDSNDNIYVSDRGNGRVQKFTTIGQYIGSWGSSGSAEGQLNIVTGLTVDDSGNVYTCEQYSYRVQKWIRDKELLKSAINVVVDRYPPNTWPNYQGTWGQNSWLVSSPTITMSLGDAGSGIDKTYYYLNTEPYQEYTGPFTITAEGSIGIYCYSTDKVGNSETPQLKQTLKIDRTGPTMTGATTTSANSDGWFNANVVVHFTATDLISGIAIAPSDATISTEGQSQSSQGISRDNAGNNAQYTVTGIKIDKTKPTSNIALTGSLAPQGHYTSDVNAVVTSTDGLSGPKEVYYKIDDQAEKTQTGSQATFSIAVGGSHIIQYWSKDTAGNTENIKTSTFQIIYTTALTVNCNPTTVNKLTDEKTTITGTLKTDQNAPIANKPINIYYQIASKPDDQYMPYLQPNANNWNPITQTPILTLDDGSYTYEWDPPETLQNGTYWLKAEFQGETGYLSSAATTGTAPFPNLFVVPEYIIGALAALGACFAAFVIYQKLSSLPTL